MAKRSKAGTDINKVRQQNQASTSQMGADTEFGSETNVQAVRQANQQSKAKAAQQQQQNKQ
ncbi:gamma-type small acid-soluble spore protein [Aneurinibacillus aneurinilyticus]|uniref:gamma-type small acid-soluble spore protein n=1 Tax=Aneurinibacillus aneurinilyticus TaxID=1391 RepID=UPI002E20F01D|nr:gamma-type small acid-soluble spore protein [Aneurinibacillus aneurinilyticus]MED0673258.1 gamma-type small acid-soluble spore protein [Aneurinibacillus aneurinilyticus]